MFKLVHQREESNWISISDLMSGLMMIFLFIAILYMNHLQIKASQIKKIAVAYQEMQNDLYEDLNEEFRADLPKWKATIDPQTLSICFREPDVYFNQGSYKIKTRFKSILNNFFPRYITIIYSDKYRDNIEEIRIEGHTSSEWNSRKASKEDAYFLNMKLSQDRTREVLQYCHGLIENDVMQLWARRHITANGLSSSHLICPEDVENRELSRRVEFRTKTAAENKVVEIIEEIKKQ